MLKRSLSGLLLAALALIAACGSSFEAGLSNAPSINRASRPKDLHDAISNGPESCGRDGLRGSDPLRHRAPPCHSEEVTTTQASWPAVKSDDGGLSTPR